LLLNLFEWLRNTRISSTHLGRVHQEGRVWPSQNCSTELLHFSHKRFLHHFQWEQQLPLVYAVVNLMVMMLKLVGRAMKGTMPRKSRSKPSRTSLMRLGRAGKTPEPRVAAVLHRARQQLCHIRFLPWHLPCQSVRL
jgi:hypothetical protein